MGGREQFIKIAVEKLKMAKEEGLDSFADLTTIDLGRDIRLLEEVSRKSGVHIVATTGHWVEPPRCMEVRSVEEMTEYFVREIQVGIEGTDIKAGVIKAANDSWSLSLRSAKSSFTPRVARAKLPERRYPRTRPLWNETAKNKPRSSSRNR